MTETRLDELHGLGVNILWIMPIHPIGEKFRKAADTAARIPSMFITPWIRITER